MNTLDRNNAPTWRISIQRDAAYLDRRADIELTAGRHSVAELLAHRADEMRQTGADRELRRVPR